MTTILYIMYASLKTVLFVLDPLCELQQLLAHDTLVKLSMLVKYLDGCWPHVTH